MRENQSLINLIGWGLIADIGIGLIALFTSCTVPRLSGPTVDDLAGSPMYYGESHDPGFCQPVSEIDLSVWPKEGEHGMTNTPMWIGEPFEEPPCDHFYIKQAHTITDTIQAGSEYQACICIYCKEINVCK